MEQTGRPVGRLLPLRKTLLLRLVARFRVDRVRSSRSAGPSSQLRLLTQASAHKEDLVGSQEHAHLHGEPAPAIPPPQDSPGDPLEPEGLE